MSIERKQYFNKPLIEIIKKRRSVRTYRSDKLSTEVKKNLKKYMENIEGPFLQKVRLEFIDGSEILENTGGTIGTYGVIKGAKDYIVAIVEEGDKDLEAIGYVLEKFILYATSLGLGTCWLGGTFKKSEIMKLVTLKEKEILPIVTPIGYPADKKSITESFMRFAAASDSRKPWKELFFEETFAKPIEEREGGRYTEALEAVRLAPSASNKQPWRILKVGEAYHFFLEATKGYGEKLGFNIQRIDMGIAMCHFEMVLQELGIKGCWNIQKPIIPPSEKDNLTYIVSWKEIL